jgi:hypothetical protein
MSAKEDKELIKLAHKRYAQICEDEKENARRFKEDLKFANGDSYNNWQWDEKVVQDRKNKGKPSFTINKIKKHNRQITNESRQNKPSIRVYPVDSEADPKTAEIIGEIIRHIENNSNADLAYNKSDEYQVDGGLGYWKIITDYVDNNSNSQDIFIEPVYDPLAIKMPRPKFVKGMEVVSYAFEDEEMQKDEFEAKYGKDIFGKQEWETIEGGWKSEDTVRVANYYYTEITPDWLYFDENGDGIKLSEVDEAQRELLKNSQLKKRKIQNESIKFCLLAADKILERKEWPGKYIPIVRVPGTELIIDGKTERKGHTRQMIGSQYMYNYWTNEATFQVALQGNQPYIGPKEAREGQEHIWDNLATETYSYLPYNQYDEEGRQIEKPQRERPPQMASAYIQGMQIANEELLATSGQENAQFGKDVGQQSGRALDALQSKSETSTYHFTDNKLMAMTLTGRMLIDLIPKIYDTQQIIRMLGEDGKEVEINIDPNQEEAYRKEEQEDGSIKEIFNPGVGTYDVIVSTGASYGTKRREAFSALSEIASRNPQLMQIAGDLIMAAADFPMADKLSERLKKALPPELQDKEEGAPEEIPPEVQQQLQQAQQVAEQSQKMIQALDDVVTKMQSELETRDVDWYKAETERMKVVQTSMNPQQIQHIVIKTMQDLLTNQNEKIEQTLVPEQPEMPQEFPQDQQQIPPEGQIM